LRTVFSSKKELVIYAVEGSYAEIYAKENNYPFSPLSKFTDDVTGVTIVTSSKGEAVVRDITGETVVDFDEVNSENIKVFEVDVLCEGESSQIENGYCSIRFPAKDKNTKVYLLSENGEFIKITSSYIYDCAVVAVDKYGVFAVVDEDYKLGDANLDGKVNVKDATHIQKAVADLLVLDEIGALAADVDGNGKVNVKDATAIQKWVADIETGLPIGKEKTA
ncbi:MAG: dockerin type I repeat-containing protein, partial [Ruminococcus sp.]|nr:dockerin type I repeat-containing protein [Ruminococcus sp.]